MKILTKATDIAKAMNFGKYTVLRINADTKEGCKVVVIKKSQRYGDMRYNCQLCMDYEKDGDGILYLSTNASCIKGNYDWQDHLESAEYANAPIVGSDQEVAVYIYSPKVKIGFVRMVKSRKVDASYSTATVFDDIEE